MEKSVALLPVAGGGDAPKDVGSWRDLNSPLQTVESN